ncbi:MAG: cation transporter [Synechococcales cyanobacterium K44_A2020_017]|nr:cation transporter [Synechococcales cyanobacterium K44_A2020_017]
MAISYRAEVQRVLVITLVLNILVAVLKAIIGSLTGSLSLIADALHSTTDGVNNILGLVTNHLSSPEPDRDHPYGHQKFEALGALGIAAFLGIACYEIIQGAIARLLNAADPVQVSGLDLWVLLGVLGINIGVAVYERRVGHHIGSTILIADAYHTMSDVWITISVMAGLLGIWIWDIQWLDLALVFPVVILVAQSCWSVLKANLPWLVDEVAIAPEAIQAAALEVPGVLNCHSIASRGMMGRQIFMEMHLVVEAADVKTAHDITEQVEDHLNQKYGPARINIHIEPPSYQSDQVDYRPEPH